MLIMLGRQILLLWAPTHLHTLYHLGSMYFPDFCQQIYTNEIPLSISCSPDSPISNANHTCDLDDQL